MREPKIALVELPATEFGKLDGEITRDIFSEMAAPPRAIPLLHGIIRERGYRDVSTNRIFSSDYLLLSAITRTIPQTAELARLYKERNPNGTVIVGGPHVTFLPEEALEWADVVVRKEGDFTLPELLERLEREHSPAGVLGVSYKAGSGVVHEPDRKLLTEEELSRLPLPFYDDEIRKAMRVSAVNTARGCPRNCDFCSVTKFYGGKYRRRTNESIIRELEVVANDGTPHLFFSADDFAGDSFGKGATKELLTYDVMEGIKRKRAGYSAQLNVNSAFVDDPAAADNLVFDDEFLELLRKSGCFAVYLGIESINDETLKELKKRGSTARKNREAVKRFRQYGIWVHGMMMVGADADTKEGLDETLEWARANLDSAQFFAPIPLPGTPFTDRMRKQGRILTRDYSLYDAQHVIIRPKNFTPYELQMQIFEMNKQFYLPRYTLPSFLRHPVRSVADAWHSVKPLHKVVINRIAGRTIDAVIERSPQTQAHLEFLKGVG